MNKIRALFARYREQILYLFFGGVTTLVNIAVYAACAALGMPTGVSNAIAWVLSVLTAYATNRAWVFQSRSAGADRLRELASFMGCRAATGVLDEAVMILGVDRLGPVVASGHLRAWGLGVKVFSNALVIVLNYVFSKLFIFRKKER